MAKPELFLVKSKIDGRTIYEGPRAKFDKAVTMTGIAVMNGMKRGMTFGPADTELMLELALKKVA